MKLALAFLTALALTHAAMDINTMQPYYPFSTLFRPAARGSFRIIGGQEVEPNSVPYQVALRIFAARGIPFCGGSILSPTTVLTAAHCVDDSRKVVAFFGKHDLRKPSETQLPVDEIIIHPAWNRQKLENDIAILRFDTPIELNEHIKVIKLPTRDDISNDFAGEMATASGWGRYSDSSPYGSMVLRSVDVSVISNEKCNQFWKGRIQPNQICISTADGRSPCQGDSGGPLVSNGKQIGITSYVLRGGCAIGFPTVFARITEYLDWIEQNSDVVID